MDSIVEVKVKVYYKYILAQILLPKLLQHATSAAVSPKRPHHRYMHHGYIHHGYMHNIMDTSAWVTRPERPKGAKDAKTRRTKSGGLKGLQLEVGARRAPRLLVSNILHSQRF